VTRTIGVNLTWLRPRLVGGTETYIRRVLRAATAGDPTIEWHLYGSQEAIAAVLPDGAIVDSHTPSKRALPPILRVVAERTWLPRSIDSSIQIMHHPGGTLPFVGTAPSLLTIHDLQPLDVPGNFWPLKQRFLARAIPNAVHRADLITTPSDWVRDSIVDRFGVDADRVVTVSAFAEPVDLSMPTQPSTELEEIFERGPVFFYPAMTLAHKNHLALFEAFDDAVRHDPDIQLVCTGATGRDDKDIRARAQATSPRIHMLGHIPRTDLDALFMRSEALVFPSRYEGFGLPVIEAQNAGLPVICSNTTALGEIAGDGATLLAPDDRNAWTAALLDRPSPAQRAAGVAAGLENARRYTIERTTAQQQSAYDRLTP
jgi:alpha-1,3-rhamnosyl/mannosyltransferase